jgi:hypothetical protein
MTIQFYIFIVFIIGLCLIIFAQNNMNQPIKERINFVLGGLILIVGSIIFSIGVALNELLHLFF